MSIIKNTLSVTNFIKTALIHSYQARLHLIVSIHKVGMASYDSNNVNNSNWGSAHCLETIIWMLKMKILVLASQLFVGENYAGNLFRKCAVYCIR